VKPKLDEFKEVPFTTDSAEYDVLQSPSSSTKIDFGYLPDQDAPAKPANAAVGANPLHGYTLVTPAVPSSVLWAFSGGCWLPLPLAEGIAWADAEPGHGGDLLPLACWAEDSPASDWSSRE
jgi:hypothetical protein